jgi:hypothetical protein
LIIIPSAIEGSDNLRHSLANLRAECKLALGSALVPGAWSEPPGATQISANAKIDKELKNRASTIKVFLIMTVVFLALPQRKTLISE